MTGLNSQNILEFINRACSNWIVSPPDNATLVQAMQHIIDQCYPGALPLTIDAINANAGEARGHLNYRNDTANVVGHMHGGAIFTAGDTLAGVYLWARTDGESVYVTAGSSIRYLRPLDAGRLDCVVRETGRDDTRVQLKAKFTNDAGKTIAVMKLDYRRRSIASG